MTNMTNMTTNMTPADNQTGGNAGQLDKVYAPRDAEQRIYASWLANGYFHAEPDGSGGEPYSIVIPPPNITGQLHMGHALDNTLQDILIRWRRMQGYSTLWMPGTDHASIATEAKIVESLEAERSSKAELGREKFLERAWQWKALYGGRIVEQLKRLGCSCDWERERFTMDAGLSAAVTEVFVRLYEDGLIYKGERITNWCPGCRTSISDIEVEYEEREGHFWYIRYPLGDGSGEYLTVATTRPETMLGDTAVAVNPDDPRYARFVGKTVLLPLMNRHIPVIADAYVDSDFGTGAVKITPAHDPNDFDVGLRHGLEQIRVMDDAAVMNENAGVYKGMTREAAREKIVRELEALGLLDKIEPHIHNVGTCSRCGATIEPLISAQWFVKMEPLAKPAIEAVRQGKTRFVPDRFAKIYYNWMENIQDWCISRQLWWGHRIPAYYCDACGEVAVARSAPERCPKCGGALRQDEDVLDTWFSSALWPFSTMGWPEKTALLARFYPTSVLVTGYDIIFFWVARMIFSGVRHMGEEPFRHVFIHGIVRDAEGRKMSKSLGNGIDPLEIIDQYGADALRFALTVGNAPGNDLRFSEDKTKAARNFANKLWNASRFVLMHLGAGGEGGVSGAKFTAADRWILAEFNALARDVTENLERFELGIALQKTYDFVWDTFCDWYIEFVKPRLAGGPDAEGRPEALATLRHVLIGGLKLLHPFMPFITEEIYLTLAARDGGVGGSVARQRGSSAKRDNDNAADGLTAADGFADAVTGVGDAPSLMVDAWPVYNPVFEAAEASRKTAFIIEVVRAVRNLRAEMNVPPSNKVSCVFVTGDAFLAGALEEARALVERLASMRSFTICRDKNGISGDTATLVAGGVEGFIPLGELVDVAKETARLKKELKSIQAEIGRASGRLANPGFTGKAPPKVVEDERAKLKDYEALYAKVAENLARISG